MPHRLRHWFRHPLRLAAVLCALAASAGPAGAQGTPPPAGPPAGLLTDRELVIGTKEAPPFAQRGPDGRWDGVSIELWQRLAQQLGLRYRFEELPTVQALLDATTNRTVDASVAALTVTAGRKRQMDFTQPFYAAGLGVAVQGGGAASWLPLLRTFLSFGFLQGVLALLGIAVTVGVLIWLFERRSNPPYGGGPVRGLAAGVYWSAIAMTQAGAAQDGPRTLPGRVLAAVWMVASVVTIAVFIAGITSALTTQRIQGLVRDVGDLRVLRVGAVSGSSAVEFLEAQRVSSRGYESPQAGLRAVRDGEIDAFVYDKPLMAWIIQRDFPALQVSAVNFDVQNYAVALPDGSPLRGPLDVALLETLRSDWWRQTLFRHMGRTGDQGAATEAALH